MTRKPKACNPSVEGLCEESVCVKVSIRVSTLLLGAATVCEPAADRSSGPLRTVHANGAIVASEAQFEWSPRC